ncbi:hypothetical protein [Pseudoalteromonas sp. P1-7a]|uniref:hypothetical protein n=1 Tax=Pseudoalteromonas sp. P1-7a TaxID=1723755 RepID=UPI0006D669CE|nr:hypothetical protein [Pseudoalteromonas sp. P1-7a]KPZ59321.1 hypothetical protein AN389_02752 [Pseudoalteromonas sp. P1-7a]
MNLRLDKKTLKLWPILLTTTNELFSGNGLTEVDLESPWGKHVNTKYGVVETFTFERDPMTINQLGDAVAIIPATPLPVN